ncbi:unnamed protein product [Closterium sp. Naga37s-1]|nr:unnamed protein product [Closterium sp. Naga37s-1]
MDADVSVDDMSDDASRGPYSDSYASDHGDDHGGDHGDRRGWKPGTGWRRAAAWKTLVSGARRLVTGRRRRRDDAGSEGDNSEYYSDRTYSDEELSIAEGSVAQSAVSYSRASTSAWWAQTDNYSNPYRRRSAHAQHYPQQGEGGGRAQGYGHGSSAGKGGKRSALDDVLVDLSSQLQGSQGVGAEGSVAEGEGEWEEGAGEMPGPWFWPSWCPCPRVRNPILVYRLAAMVRGGGGKGKGEGTATYWLFGVGLGGVWRGKMRREDMRIECRGELLVAVIIFLLTFFTWLLTSSYYNNSVQVPWEGVYTLTMNYRKQLLMRPQERVGSIVEGTRNVSLTYAAVLQAGLEAQREGAWHGA